MTDFYAILTADGITEVLDCVASNRAFAPTKMSVGDSNGSYYEPEKNQATLKNPLYEGNVFAQGKMPPSNNRAGYLYFCVQVPPSEGNYTIREVGLFSQDGKLWAVAKYPETLKTKADETSNKTLNIEIQIELSDMILNTITIDNSGNLVTRQVLEEYQALNEKGKMNGYAPLDNEAKVPLEHLPNIRTPWAYGMSQYLTEDPKSASWLASLGQDNSKDLYPGIYNWIEENVNNGTANFKGTTAYAFRNIASQANRWITTPVPKIGQAVYYYNVANGQSICYIDGYIEEITDTGFTFTNIENTLITTIRNTTDDSTIENAPWWITDYDFVLKENSFKLPLKNGNEDLIDYNNYTDGVYGTEYIAPYDGFVLFRCENIAHESGNTAATITSTGDINGETVFAVKASSMNNLVSNDFEDQSGGAGVYKIERGQKYRLYTAFTIGNTFVNKSLIRLFQAKGNGTLYYYVGGNVKNQGEIDAGEMTSQMAILGGEIANIKPKMSPDYANPKTLKLIKDLVQSITEDGYIWMHSSYGFIAVSKCDADGTITADLLNSATPNGNTNVTVWSPLIKKGSYIKVNQLSGTSNQLRFYPATGGITNVNNNV